MTDTASRPPLLPLAEAGLQLGEHPAAVFNRAVRGELRAWKVRGRWQVAADDVRALLKEREAPAPTAAAR